MALQPAARWTLPPHLDLTGLYSVGIVAFHRNGIQQALFGFNGQPGTIPVDTYSVNPQTTGWEYHLAVPTTLIPTGNYFLSAGAIASDGTSRQVPNLPVNIWTGAATYTTFYVNADTGSNGNDGLTPGTAFLTLRFALEALAGNGDGGRIYLIDATNSYGLANLTTVPVTTTRYLNIELAPGSSKASVNLAQWPVAAITGITKLRFRGITIKVPILGASTDTVLFDDCHLTGTGPQVPIGATGWTPGWGARYFIDGEVSNCLNGLFAFDLVRGATVTSIGGAAFQSCACVIDSTATTVGAGITFIDASSQDNLIGFNIACHDCSIGMEFHPSLAQTLTNCAFVNVVADASIYSRIRDYALDHFILRNCTFPGHTFTLSTDSIAFSVFQQNCFLTLASAAGDILGPPSLALLNPIFSDTHYITPGAITPGSATTTGSAGFTNEGANDFTPAAGSDLLDQHTAPKLAPCDAEKVARDLITTVGALRGADEGAATGTEPPEDLDYNPAGAGVLQVIGQTQQAIPTITPTWQGTITEFRLEPSIYHIYKAPDEIPATPDMAHYEVRAWASGDPTDPSLAAPGHLGWIIEDLRNGKKYLRNPKSPPHNAPLATACNLAAPHASNAGTYTHSQSGGPFAIADGPPYGTAVIRVRATTHLGVPDVFSQLSMGTSFGPKVGYSGDSGGFGFGYYIGWAKPGFGGFYPLSTPGSQGQGIQIRLKVVGATGNKADKIFPISMGPGFKKPDGTADDTYCPIDVLFKDFTIYTDHVGTHDAFVETTKGQRSGRIRLYDCTFSPELLVPPLGGGGSGGSWGTKQVMHLGGALHTDFRRLTFPPALEHGVYTHAHNAGILRDVTASSGETADSWFIECVWPEGTGRTMFQFVDRPYDHLQVGSLSIKPTPAFRSLPGGKGVVLFERCKSFKATAVFENASAFTMVGGADMTFLFRDNEIHQTGQVGATQVLDAKGGLNPTTIHNRGLIAFGWAAGGTSWGYGATIGKPFASAIRINENGYAVRRVVIVSHFDHTDHPNEKRMSFRGCEEVHIYGFDLNTVLGQGKADIGMDEVDANPPTPWYLAAAGEQWNLDGELVYSVAGEFTSTPLSVAGPNHPPNNNSKFFLYMGYPALPAAWHGWTAGAGAPSIIKATFPSSAPAVEIGASGANAMAGTPIYLPTGITLNPTTGVISGTPTQGIGKGFLGETFGTLINSPQTYTDSVPSYANIPVRGSNPSSADSWDGDGIQLLIAPLGGGAIFPVAPTAVVQSYFPQPGDVLVAVDVNFESPTAEVRSDVGGFGLIVEDAGGSDMLTTPTAEVRAWLDGALVDAPTFIVPPTAEVRVFFDAVFVGQTIANSDGQVVTSGCQDGQVVF